MVSATLISYCKRPYTTTNIHRICKSTVKRSVNCPSQPYFGEWPMGGWILISPEVELVTFVGVMSEALCRSTANSEAPFPAACDSNGVGIGE